MDIWIAGWHTLASFSFDTYTEAMIKCLWSKLIAHFLLFLLLDFKKSESLIVFDPFSLFSNLRSSFLFRFVIEDENEIVISKHLLSLKGKAHFLFDEISWPKYYSVHSILK